MAGLAGQPPKPDGERINRVPPVHEWVDVLNVPYRGKRPALPKELSPATRSWWRVVSTMPHCIRWTPDDWQFALDTATVHHRFTLGVSGADAELRRRGELLGITWSARRSLRIRYVDAVTEQQAAPVDADTLNFEEERRRRLLGAG